MLAHLQAALLGIDWLDPEKLLDALGNWALWGAAAIIFAECGLLIGFFLPGDSLLFTVGLLITTDVIDHPLWLACVVLTAAAFVGNVVGYEIGRATGPAVFRREGSRLFNPKHAEKTMAFFQRHGVKAIVLARFVPIVRTFITVMAGVGRMHKRRYLTYSGIGAILWATGVTLLGAALGRFDFVHRNIDLILIAVVLLSILPMVIEYLRVRAHSRRVAQHAAEADATPGP